MLQGKCVLITGGTGSFGRKFVEHLLIHYPEIARIVIFSRDELKQYEMANEPIFREYARKLRFFIGDVRDQSRLTRACEGIDYIVHAAALKQVPAAEYNPMECIKTNIFGAENVINAALDCGVRRVVALSTDKAAAPINLYGATKLCSDKLFVAANNIKGSRDLKFSVVRYGNVLGSRGSVIPFFLSKREEGSLPITDHRMTRFSISLEDGVKLVLKTLEHAWGGEIVVPKIPSYRILDVAKAVAPNCKYEEVGIRPGEKLHEEMITETDSFYTVEFEDSFVVCPPFPQWDQEEFIKHFDGKRVPYGFKYNSGTNSHFLTVQEIREQIKKYVAPNLDLDPHH